MVASCGYEQRQRQVSRYCKYELPYNSDDLMVQCEECKACNIRWNKLQDVFPPEIGELKQSLSIAVLFMVTNQEIEWIYIFANKSEAAAAGEEEGFLPELHALAFALSLNTTVLNSIELMYSSDFCSCLLASNGNPRLSDSLHYIDPSGRNHRGWRVLQFYDSDKRFPAWGFGARPIDGPVSHCFNLNGSTSYCEVEGIQGIMMAYTNALFNVSLAGPTLFGPVNNAAAHIAGESATRKEQKYYILFLMLDSSKLVLCNLLTTIIVSVPLPSLREAPNIQQIDGDWSGSLEFVVPAADPSSFFPNICPFQLF
nr:protein BONZAI 1-like [Ipomoea batatas]